MSSNTTPCYSFSRPWLRTFLPAGAILALIIIAFASHGEKLNLPHLHDLKPFSKGPSVDHTASGITKAIVTSVQAKDETTADWVAEFLPDWQAVVYVTDRTSDYPVSDNASLITPNHLPVNKGREASVYLTYIIQNYYTLPDYMVFIHGKRYQIHNDDPMMDTLPLIQRLNLEHVSKEGYASLRCNWQSCPKAIVSPVVGHDDSVWEIKGLWAAAYSQFFPHEPVPESVAGPCCAQFAVSREAVRRLPIDKYEQVRQWIWTLDIMSADYKAGQVMEMMWHILFGKPAYYCPPAKECYCGTWGMCDLECEREGWCLGRMWRNPEKNKPIFGMAKPIPDAWPSEGQSKPGEGGYFPYQDWDKNPEVIQDH